MPIKQNFKTIFINSLIVKNKILLKNNKVLT